MNKAKELLKEAGYSDGGFSLEITYITGDEIERKSAELYQSELNKLGITLNIRPVTSDMSVETDVYKRQILERVKENHDRPLLENNKTVEYIAAVSYTHLFPRIVYDAPDLARK